MLVQESPFFHKIVNRRLALLLSRFFFSRKLSIKIIINLYHKNSSNKNKVLQKNILPYCINEWNELNGIVLGMVLRMLNQLRI